MKPRIAVGLESTLDTLITFPELGDFENFAGDYEGDLASEIREGLETVKSNSGGEMPIDGNREEANRLRELAEEAGADIDYRLGGNASQEAVTFERLNAQTIFTGSIFPGSFSKYSDEIRKSLERIDMKFAKNFEEYNPTSYILQASDTNRYILSEGEGRRIEQLRPYLKDLPDIIREIAELYGGLDAISIVGLHVLFGNQLTRGDCRLLIRMIEEIRKATDATLFTDAGGIAGLGEEGTKRLWKIYSVFDVLSLNEDELFQASKEVGEDGSMEVEKMDKLLEESENLSTVWLHTPNYQATLSGEFSSSELEKAQKVSAAAGLYKVETGKFPFRKDIISVLKTHDLSTGGKEKRREILEKCGKEWKGRNLVVSPCFQAESFVSTVGAGDVSSAAYLHTLIEASE